MERKQKRKTPQNSAGAHPSCAMGNVTWRPPGDEQDFNWHGAGKAEEGMQTMSLVGKCSR